jgi:hypothetical protein
VPEGVRIMDIVPQHESLVIEAFVSPDVIDRMRAGMPTDIRFPGFVDLPFLAVDGRVLSISADRIEETAARPAHFLARVEARFGVKPGEWHSGMTATERRRLWRMTAEGGVGLVVGARSALFLPFRDLGLIVVDEEHDTSYKQEEGVLYHARDMAVLRASILGCQVVLSSATPSLESWANAQAGKYTRIDLGARFGQPHAL